MMFIVSVDHDEGVPCSYPPFPIANTELLDTTNDQPMVCQQ